MAGQVTEVDVEKSGMLGHMIDFMFSILGVSEFAIPPMVRTVSPLACVVNCFVDLCHSDCGKMKSQSCFDLKPPDS